MMNFTFQYGYWYAVLCIHDLTIKESYSLQAQKMQNKLCIYPVSTTADQKYFISQERCKHTSVLFTLIRKFTNFSCHLYTSSA